MRSSRTLNDLAISSSTLNGSACGWCCCDLELETKSSSNGGLRCNLEKSRSGGRCDVESRSSFDGCWCDAESSSGGCCDLEESRSSSNGGRCRRSLMQTVGYLFATFTPTPAHNGRHRSTLHQWFWWLYFEKPKTRSTLSENDMKALTALFLTPKYVTLSGHFRLNCFFALIWLDFQWFTKTPPVRKWIPLLLNMAVISAEPLVVGDKRV